jgi:putative transposase
MIERTHPKLSVGAQCRLLSISRSSFHDAPQGETALNLDLMLLIDKQFLQTPFHGVRQMTWHLQNEGHAVNEKRIRRLMRLMPICQKPYTRKPAKGHKTYPDLLGGLRIDRPNQVWCNEGAQRPLAQGHRQGLGRARRAQLAGHGVAFAGCSALVQGGALRLRFGDGGFPVCAA